MSTDCELGGSEIYRIYFFLLLLESKGLDIAKWWFRGQILLPVTSYEPYTGINQHTQVKATLDALQINWLADWLVLYLTFLPINE